MIETLRIQNLAILESAELQFGRGLNVLTGETGAGKSIVLGALALLAGGRAASRSVRDGAEEGVVEALFQTDRAPDLEAELEARGLSADAHELVVRRTFSRSGRGRAQLAGALVPVATLAELFQGRLEISSQHDSQGLLRTETHGLLLDSKGGLQPLRDSVGEGFRALREIDDDLARLRAEVGERMQRRDFLAFQLKEIDDAELDADEMENLRGERARLAHAERFRVEGGRVLAGLIGDPLQEDAHPAADTIAEAERGIGELAALDPRLSELVDRLKTAQTDVRETGLELERYLDGINAEPARLAALEERLYRVEQLQRKYGADVPAILKFREQGASELASLEGADDRERELEARRETLARKLGRDAKKLTAGRTEAAGSLARAVQASLRELAMPQARFSVELRPAAPPANVLCGPNGSELPEFVFTANRGEPPHPLRKVASGGELSRVFLALKKALREAGSGMVLVFDEVDAGIGGEAADRVGRQLAALAAHHQVICITHLPQIAAFAERHFRVEKSEKRGRAAVGIASVEGDARVEEIARMAGGKRVGKATRQHARELLGARAPR